MVTKSLIILISLILLLSLSNPTAISAQTAALTKIAYDSTTNDLTPVWSADGRSVLIAKAIYPADKRYKTQIFEIVLDPLSQPRLLLEIDGMISAPAWSPDRRLIAYAKEDTVFVQNRDGKTLLQVPGYFAQWSPDGAHMLVWTRQGLSVASLDRQTSVQLTSTEPTSDMYWSGTAWSPDGQHVLVTMLDDIYVFYVRTGRQTNLTHSNGKESNPMWSPDGTMIVFSASASYDDIPASDDLLGSPLYLIRSDGTGLTRLTDSRYYDTCPAWSPDGTKLAFVRGDDPESGTLMLLDLASKTLSWLDRPDGKSVQCPQWSPDGQQLLVPAIFFEWEQGVSLYVASLAAFKSDITAATLVNRVVFLTVSDPPAAGIHVRGEPSSDSPSIDILSNGNLIRILDTQQASDGSTWLYILYQTDHVGWINQFDLIFVARNLDPNIFCYDSRPQSLIAALQEAVRARDGNALARLIAPSGMYVSVGGGKTLHLSYSEVQNFFGDHEVRDWGSNGYSPNTILKSLADGVTDSLVSDLLPDNVSIQCNNNQDALSGLRELFHLNIPNYKIVNFYSIMRPGAAGNELDWGAWGIAVHYWEGQPVILGLTSYHWTP